MDKNNHLSFETKAIHAGQKPDPSTGAIMTPIYQTSTYVQQSPGVHQGYEYSRSQNPTRAALEANLASLEGAEFGLCFSSGCAGLSTLLHTLKAGDHVVVCDDVYGGTLRIFDKVFAQLGVQYTLADLTSSDELKSALRSNTRWVWVETPTNPMLKIIDIEQVVSVTKQHASVKIAVDNTFATPYLQNPLKLGADLVCHSTTKYLGGHSDVVGGALLTNDKPLFEDLSFMQNAIGAIPSPQDCFLVLRSTKTLAVRMKAHCENARIIAEKLQSHAQIEQVIYPGLESHPQHNVASKQMRDYGGMISLVLKGDLEQSRRFLENVQVFSLAESLGGVESLIEHPAIMTHASIPAEHRKALGILDGLVRLSVGIEHVDDLIEDLEQALDRCA